MPLRSITCRHCHAMFEKQPGVGFLYCPTCGLSLEGSTEIDVYTDDETQPSKAPKAELIPRNNGTAHKSPLGDWFCLVCKRPLQPVVGVDAPVTGGPSWTLYDCLGCGRCVTDDGSIPAGTYQISDPVVAIINGVPKVETTVGPFSFDIHVVDLEEDESPLTRCQSSWRDGECVHKKCPVPDGQTRCPLLTQEDLEDPYE